MGISRTSVIRYILWNYTCVVQATWLGFFYLPTIFIYPSVISVAMCLTGAIASILFYSMLMSLEDLKRLKELLSGYLEKFSKCEFHQFQISDYVEENSQIGSEVSADYFKLFGRKFKYYWKRNIQIYVVKQGKSSVLPSQLATYEYLQPSLPCFIFVRDEPSDITPIGRYYIYHEIGHASLPVANIRIDALLGWKLLMISAILAIIGLQPNIISFSIFGVYILCLALSHRSYGRWLEELLLLEEINADQFAVRCLSNKSKLDLVQHVKAEIDSAYPSEKNLFQLDQQQLKAEFRSTSPSRNKIFQLAQLEFLLDYLEEPDDLSGENNIKMLQSLHITRFLIASAVVAPILGFLGRHPSTTLLWTNVGLAIVGLFTMIWLVLRKSKLLEKVNGYLSGTTNLTSSPTSTSAPLHTPLSAFTPTSINKSAPSSRQPTQSSSTKLLIVLSIGILICIVCCCFMCLFTALV